MSRATELWKQFQGKDSPIPDLTPEAENVLVNFSLNLLTFYERILTKNVILRHLGDVYCAIQDGAIVKHGIDWSKPCVVIIDQDDDWGVYRYFSPDP